MPKSYDHDDEVTAEIDALDDDDDNGSEPTQVQTAPPHRARPVQRPAFNQSEVTEPPTAPPPPAPRAARPPAPNWDAPQATMMPPPQPPPRQYYFEESRSGSRIFNLFTFLSLIVGLLSGALITVLAIKPEVAKKIAVAANRPAATPTAAPKAPAPAAPTKPEVSPPSESETASAAPPTTAPVEPEPQQTAVVTNVPPAGLAARNENSGENSGASTAASNEPKNYIKDIKITPGSTFIKVGVNAGAHRFSYSSKMFENPYRLVIDLQGLNGTFTKPKIDSAEGPITSIRVSKRSKNETRLVIDFEQGINPKFMISKVDQGLSILIQKQ